MDGESGERGLEWEAWEDCGGGEGFMGLGKKVYLRSERRRREGNDRFKRSGVRSVG